MKIERSFDGDTSRYAFDNDLMAQGYLQLDTKQDASYYGHWVNLDTLHIVGFCEGDITKVQCENGGELREYIEGMYQFLHIDAGLRTRDAAMARAEELGILEFMA